VRYLSLVANGHALDMVFIARDLKDTLFIPTGAISQQEALQILEQYCAYYKQGHDDYFYFYVALGFNDLNILLGDYDDFWDAYERSIEKEMDYTFKEVYLEKAISFGFFSEDNYQQLCANTYAILSPIIDRLPDLFKEIKKDKK